ncbi:hypothetical protein DRO49_04030 [Candidatus Bathyarchaeota archaeon]|nr:MAG: hypothetical protein DRO49_04030 [Candidatus Bathyarchaeota archaeon]
MTMKMTSPRRPILLGLYQDELILLALSLLLDSLDYLIPTLSIPRVGDIVDLLGLVFAVLAFSWLGFITLLELIPGFDVIPSFTITWFTWYILRERRLEAELEAELERWR